MHATFPNPLRPLGPRLRLVQELVDESRERLVILVQEPMSRVGIQVQRGIRVDQLPPERDAVLGRHEQVIRSRK